MRPVRSTMSGVRSLVLFWAACALSGCAYVWSAPHPQVQGAVEARPEQVRVTRTDGLRLVVGHPTIRGDSLLGEIKVEGSEDLPSSGAIALADVRSVSTRDVSIGMTSLRILFAVGVTYGLLFALAALFVGSLNHMY
jgi:hypothetical protein